MKPSVICIWSDLHNPRAGFYRAFWCNSPDSDTGCTVVGYAESGGSFRTIKDTAADALERHPGEAVNRNGKHIAVNNGGAIIMSAMKIKPEHYRHMCEAIRPVLPSIPSEKQLALNPRVRDAAVRRRWDALWAAGLSEWISNTLYPYGINDNHIDTALRAIMKELQS